MTAALLGAYRPGESVLHRIPPGVKLFGLLLISLGLALMRSWPVGVAALLGAVALTTVAGVPLRPLLRGLRVLLLTLVLLAGWLTWQSGWPRAVETVSDLLAVILLASVITATTPVDAMLDTLVRALGPLRRLGVDPERVSLAASLVLRAVPATMLLAEETRDAARARGLERDLRARLTPFVLRVVADAHATGEALDARGIGAD